MKNPINIILAIIAIGLLGWVIYQSNSGNNSNTPASTKAEVFDASGSTQIDVEGTDTKIIEKRDANGNLTESGAMLNGLKTGTWVTYHPEQRIKTISSYVGGKLNGIHMELSNRGMVELESFYKDGQLNGNYISFKSGSRKVEERSYKMGQLDGMYRKYYERQNKIQQEISYKNGVQDGPYRFYDEEGNITMEYEYKNGEKISGGIVEKK